MVSLLPSACCSPKPSPKQPCFRHPETPAQAGHPSLDAAGHDRDLEGVWESSASSCCGAAPRAAGQEVLASRAADLCHVTGLHGVGRKGFKGFCSAPRGRGAGSRLPTRVQPCWAESAGSGTGEYRNNTWNRWRLLLQAPAYAPGFSTATEPNGESSDEPAGFCTAPPCPVLPGAAATETSGRKRCCREMTGSSCSVVTHPFCPLVNSVQVPYGCQQRPPSFTGKHQETLRH